MLSRAWMEVDLGGVVRNASSLAAVAQVPLIPMIKADAYGLGAVEVALALESLDPLAYGIATVAEGIELRAAGIDRPIVLFTPILQDEYGEAKGAGLTPSLASSRDIESWAADGHAYYLSIDTGMARAGVGWRDVGDVAASVALHPPAAVYTHFQSPGDMGKMAEQHRRFDEALDAFAKRPPVLHTDSSAAIVRHGRSRVSAVRPGIFLYGVGSGEDALCQPESVVRVQARIVDLRTVETGDTVSYEATWAAPERSTIATLPIGYADGYPRGASNAGVAVVRGSMVKIAGRVTMDMIMLDVTGTGAGIGDVVTLIGDPRETGAPIDVASVADFAALSPYELLTGLRGRLTRIYRREL
ncbi:MAG: alanine racemase [Gemmatimonadaceae bacterium]